MVVEDAIRTGDVASDRVVENNFPVVVSIMNVDECGDVNLSEVIAEESEKDVCSSENEGVCDNVVVCSVEAASVV